MFDIIYIRITLRYPEINIEEIIIIFAFKMKIYIFCPRK